MCCTISEEEDHECDCSAEALSRYVLCALLTVGSVYEARCVSAEARCVRVCVCACLPMCVCICVCVCVCGEREREREGERIE